MQHIVIDKPYCFVPPSHGDFWPLLLRRYLPRYLSKHYGIESSSVSGIEHLKTSLAAGHGILLTPNHCRPCDPMVVALAAHQLAQPLYVMASWHLFMQSRLFAWLLPRMGAFSVYREGLDREAIKCAIDVLGAARRPLVIFPEGTVSRTNDRLNHLMEGTAFIARNAAKHRAAASPPGKVVVHPVAIRYFFGGDIQKAVTPTLEEIEQRLSWQPQRHKSLLGRIGKIGDALLTLKEIEYFGNARTGTFAERLTALIDQLLVPLEDKWLKGKREGDVVSRVKTLRAAILPDMVAGQGNVAFRSAKAALFRGAKGDDADAPVLSEEERAERWRQLADLYLAQQVSFYPPDYFDSPPTPEQMLETVERFEEDLTDDVRIYRPLHAAVAVGEAIEVCPTRDRSQQIDPLMAEVRRRLETLLSDLKGKRP